MKQTIVTTLDGSQVQAAIQIDDSQCSHRFLKERPAGFWPFVCTICGKTFPKFKVKLKTMSSGNNISS